MAGLATMNAVADPLPVMVGDFNTEPGQGIAISSLYAVGSQVFFLGKDTTHGTELWRSDGTTVGTWMVKDIVAGHYDSGVDMLGQTNGLLLFSISSGKFAGVWRSDGTEEGTFRVAEVKAKNARGLGGLMWFDGTTSGATPQESQPWRTDGTIEGTFSLGLAPQATAAPTARAIKPRTTIITLPFDWVGPLQPERFQFASMSGGHFFINGDRGVWKSGGTVATTECIAALPESTGSLVRIENSGSWLSLLSSHNDDGLDWWASNGAAGELVQLCDGASWHAFQIIGKIGNESVAMVTLRGSGDREFWKSDGTPSGTVRIAADPAAWSEAPSAFTVSEGKIYFSAHTPADGREPWVLDPETGSIVMLKSIKPKDSSSSPGNFRSVGGALYFTAYDKTGGHLWSNAGKQGAIKAMTSLLPKGWSILNDRISSIGDALFFTASHRDLGVALWRKDANAKTAVRVSFTGIGTGSFMMPSDEWVLDREPTGSVIHFAGRNEDGRLIWRSDGTAAGTYALEPLRNKRNRWFDSVAPVEINGRVVFTGADPLKRASGALLAATDRPASAGLIGGIPKDAYPLSPEYLTRSGDHVYFLRQQILWTTDGTGAGTHPLSTGAEILHGNIRLLPDGLGRVYVRDWGSIWLADADADLGTMTKVDTGRTEQAVVHEGSLFFLRTTGNVMSLWRNDGVANGSTKLAEVNGATTLTSSAGLLWITATVGPWDTAYNCLWRSDGTAEGTLPVATTDKYRVVRAVPGLPDGATCIFFAEDQIWASDGTKDGTVLAVENVTQYWQEAEVVGNQVYFSGYDEVHGHELWRTDGTAEGTMMVADITGDSGSSSPAHLVLAGNRLFFIARTLEYGWEWYSLDVSAELE